MEKSLFVKNTIIINAPAAKVWDVLTNPHQTKKYMFGCETVSDWKKGSTLEWVAPYEGKDVVFVKGTIKEIQPWKLLAYTTIDATAPLKDSPENYLVATYELSEDRGKTTLNVTQGDFAKVADSEKRYADVYNNGEGWNPIMVQIKEIAEGQ
jgi:uncharacterized protein YndB with AHSA1/START domain